MNNFWIKNSQSNDNIRVVFLGWSCDETSINSFTFDESYNYLFFYDYTDLSFDAQIVEEIKKYSNIELYAWSFGVWVANKIVGDRVRLNRAVAINGTLSPIDKDYGIAPRIFDYTLKMIEREGISVFNQRMCGDNIVDYVVSGRDFSSQFIELEAFKKHCIGETIEKNVSWSVAVISGQDKIFPPENMVKFWTEKGVEIVILDNEPHFFSKMFINF